MWHFRQIVRFCQPSQRAKASIQKLAFSEPPTTISMGANASNQMLVFEGCETGPYWESKATVPPLQLQRWHSAIFQMEPRCGSAHSGFLKLLPNPRTVLTNCSRGVIAAGTSDSQIGVKQARAIIRATRTHLWLSCYGCAIGPIASGSVRLLTLWHVQPERVGEWPDQQRISNYVIDQRMNIIDVVLCC
jgi:hypothetical protein